MLTFGQAKDLLAQYAGRGGRCPDSDGVDLFVLEVLQYLLYSGANQDLRKFTFFAQNGCFTVPYEVESIQKVKIDNIVGAVYDKWFEFHSSNQMIGDCLLPQDALFEEPNYYSTAYDMIPGWRVATLGTCDESDDAHVIFQGKDTTGREIFSTHKGVQVSGEYISVKKGQKTYGQIPFGEITAIQKTKTNGYVQVLAINPTNTAQSKFLSDYSPIEELPAYRRYRVSSQFCRNCPKVTILARIRLKERYSENDRIPFETLHTIRLAGQKVYAEANNDLQMAQAKEQSADRMIEKEAAHKRVQNGSPIEFYYPTSAGKIRNIIGGIHRFWINRR